MQQSSRVKNSFLSFLYEGLPAVITMSPPASDRFIDGDSIVEGCRKLEGAGAAVVGLNCGRGPATMLPLLKQLKAELKVKDTAQMELITYVYRPWFRIWGLDVFVKGIDQGP